MIGIRPSSSCTPWFRYHWNAFKSTGLEQPAQPQEKPGDRAADQQHQVEREPQEHNREETPRRRRPWSIGLGYASSCWRLPGSQVDDGEHERAPRVDPLI